MIVPGCEHGVPGGLGCQHCIRQSAARRGAGAAIRKALKSAPDADPVNHPDHYTVGGIETIDFIEAKLSPEEFAGYCKGNIIKYLSRGRHKGTEAQDYQKAQWYCARLVEAVADGGLEGNDKR
jgi:hypothetical protein